MSIFNRFFPRASSLSSAGAHSVPAGKRIYAIGDIHGRLDLFDHLLSMIEEDDQARGPASTNVILLGDLVDRGPASAQLLARVIDLKAESDRLRVVKGNHEEAMLAALDGDLRAFGFFLMFGGEETLKSYGIDADEIDHADHRDLLTAFSRHVPADHVALLRSAEDYVQIGGYLFTHAGIRPGVALSDQSPADLRWIREPFLNSDRPFPHMVIHGHTPHDAVQIRSNRIGIDTAAYETGCLTAIGLEGEDRWFVQT